MGTENTVTISLERFKELEDHSKKLHEILSGQEMTCFYIDSNYGNWCKKYQFATTSESVKKLAEINNKIGETFVKLEKIADERYFELDNLKKAEEYKKKPERTGFFWECLMFQSKDPVERALGIIFYILTIIGVLKLWLLVSYFL